MKKILSIILALTLIIGLVPTAFADDTAPEPISVTYNFTTLGHSNPSTNTRLEATAGGKQQTTLNEDATKGGAWAYLGTTTKSYRATNDSNRIVYIGETHASFTLDEDTYIAFKIKTSESGIYNITNYEAFIVNDGTADDIKMYIVPMTTELEAKLNATNGTAWGDNKGTSRTGELSFEQLGITASPLGTYSAAKTSGGSGVGKVDVTSFSSVYMESNTEYALILYSKNGGQNGISSLTLTKEVAMPAASLTAESTKTYNGGKIALTGKLTASDGVTDITSQATDVIFESSTSSVATVDNSGVVTGVSAGTADITVTYTYEEKEYSAICSVTITKVEKDVTHYLGTNYMTDAAKTAAGAALDSQNRLSNMSFADEYSEIKSGLWGIAADFSNCGMTLFPGYWRAYGKKGSYLTDSEGSRIVLKLKVEYTGIYDIKARTDLLQNGAEADVYIIPINDNVTKITSDVLKSFPVLGRVSCVGESGNVVSPICTTRLEEGEYYVVFNMNSDNPSADAEGNQPLIIRHIALTESTNVEDEAKTESVQISAPTIAVTSNLPNAKIDVTTLDYVGASYTLGAPDEEGYTFLGWKRGVAEKNGESYIETNGTSKFTDYKQNDIIKVYTNTFLTAVYEKNEPAATENPIIKFWNQDKSFLGAIAKDDITTLPVVSLIGHSFKGWFTSPGKALVLDDVTVDTNAVASYEENSYLDADNAYDKVRVNGEDVSESKYGEAVVCEDNNGIVTHWLRDGKIVSYDKKYTHYIWDGTNIYSSYAEIEKKPIVLLESTTIDGAYMIEYDGAGKEIVEVGILFGEAGSTPIVGSAFDKYVSQRNGNHGQLAAKPINESYTIARGYMIYKDGNSTYVIYSE